MRHTLPRRAVRKLRQRIAAKIRDQERRDRAAGKRWQARQDRRQAGE